MTTKASPDTVAMMNDLVYQHHTGLAGELVSIDILFAFAEVDEETGAPNGVALKRNGARVLGMARIVSLKDRAKGCADAEITLDGDHWATIGEAGRRALLDHELEHLQVKVKEGVPQKDDHGRPKLRIKPHDAEAGVFHAVAERYGQASAEVQQIRQILETPTGQIAWAWAAESESKLVASGGGVAARAVKAQAEKRRLAAVETTGASA